MSILNIREAKREGSRVVIGIAGISGSGKTYTALQIAEGMVNSDTRKIGFIDTENKRGSLYADTLSGPFLIGDLFAPFSPQRYAEAIKEFQSAGVEVLVVDSGSHEWEGDGGCEDIAQNTGGRMANWKLAKSEHKKFMRALLQCDMDIIITFRAREKTDFSNPKEPKSLGVQPICEKNVMFEMTASFMIWNEGVNQQYMKLPSFLRPAFNDGNGYLGVECGKKIREIMTGAGEIDRELQHWQNRLQVATDGGVKSLQAEWSKVPKHLQMKLAGHKEQCKSAAMAFDDQQEQDSHKQATRREPVVGQAFNPAKPAELQPENGDANQAAKEFFGDEESAPDVGGF